MTGQDVSAGWSARICNSRRSFHPPFRLGIIRGEGVGPEVIDAALNVLRALEGGTFSRFDVRMAGAADPNRAAGDGRLTSGLEDFCRDIFAGGGVILSGPREGRFVYDLRRCFDLFCKIVPLKVSNVLSAENRLKREHIEGVDILLLRENAAGLYQGDWRIEESSAGERKAIHSFAYSESEVRRIVEPAARIAASRKGKLTVIVKDGGLPAISQIWRDCGAAAARAANVQCSFVNIDLAAYLLIQNPRDLDVIVAPNLFGDILADLGAVLIGGRGLSFSGNFAADGAAVYQTNHGAALDLAGTNRANPVGQIYSLAMLLRESFGLAEEARIVEDAVASVWREGWRTEDMTNAGRPLVGCAEMGDLVAEAVAQSASNLRIAV